MLFYLNTLHCIITNTKRYLNETHFVDQVNSSIKLSTQEKDIHKLIYQRNTNKSMQERHDPKCGILAE